jgi:hypothetical protein
VSGRAEERECRISVVMRFWRRSVLSVKDEQLKMRSRNVLACVDGPRNTGDAGPVM